MQNVFFLRQISYSSLDIGYLPQNLALKQFGRSVISEV